MARNYPDAESVLVSWLLSHTTSVNCVVDVPLNLGEPGTDPVVQLRRIGGPKRLPNIDLPTVDFDCFHFTRVQASDLAEEISTLMMHTLPGSYLNIDGVRASISHVREIAGVAQRMYDNPNVFRFGFTTQALIKSSLIP
jgi:hypothetical protein